MNFISNIFNNSINFFVEKIHFFYNTEKKIIEEPYDEPVIVNHNNDSHNDSHINYFFINTANIYKASDILIEKLRAGYNNKYIKIYLLKSDTLKPLFKNTVKLNDSNINKIKYKLSTHRRHLHTFIDAIDSYIEYNNIRNYTIIY